ELTWVDPVSRQSKTVTEHVKRGSFAKNFASEPASLQAATMVALAGELLRGSYFAGGNRALTTVLELAAQASPEVVQRPSMKSFLSFVQEAEKVRLGGTGR